MVLYNSTKNLVIENVYNIYLIGILLLPCSYWEMISEMCLQIKEKLRYEQINWSSTNIS